MAATSHIKGADSKARRVTSFGLATWSLFWKILQIQEIAAAVAAARERKVDAPLLLLEVQNLLLSPSARVLQAWPKQINDCWEKATRRQFRFGLLIANWLVCGNSS